MIVITKNEEETVLAGESFVKKLKPGCVVAFYGDLGAGKTAFIRGMAKGLGLKARVSSPTFTIVNEYDGAVPLFHFDMYRLKSSEELFEIGWEDYVARGGICAVEWSEIVEDAFYPDTVRVKIRKTGDTERQIEMVIPGGEGETI